MGHRRVSDFRVLGIATALASTALAVACTVVAPGAPPPSDTVAATTTYTVEAQLHETAHLPKGVRIEVTRAKPGKREQTYEMSVLNGVESTGALVRERVITTAVPAEIWVGTSRRSTASVKHLKTGTKISKMSNWVTDDSEKVDGAEGRLAVSARLVDAPNGTRYAIICLGPDGTELVGEPDALAKHDEGQWWDFYQYWDAQDDDPIEPAGAWIAIVEIDDLPAAWKTFSVR